MHEDWLRQSRQPPDAPVKLQDAGDSVFFDTGLTWDSAKASDEECLAVLGFVPVRNAPPSDAEFRVTAIDQDKGTLTFSSFPKQPEPLFAVSRSLRADQAYAVDTSAFQRAIEQETDAMHAQMMEAMYGIPSGIKLTDEQREAVRAACAYVDETVPDDADEDEELYGCD